MAARYLGIDVTRFPQCSPDYGIVQLIRRSRADVVLDIGANSGQYGVALRRFGYHGRIVSFEPLDGPLAQLRRTAEADPLWSALPYALGDRETTITLNVAANDGASSSVLPMLGRTTRACPEARYVGRQEAEQRRLDAVWPEVTKPGERVFVKLDVQGYEEAVLRGSGDCLASCCGLQMEVSAVPLYEGSLLFARALEMAESEYGLSLMTVIPVFSDQRTSQVLQYDVVLLREPEAVTATL
jgi:FkbM family methyltransferase